MPDKWLTFAQKVAANAGAVEPTRQPLSHIAAEVIASARRHGSFATKETLMERLLDTGRFLVQHTIAQDPKSGSHSLTWETYNVVFETIASVVYMIVCLYAPKSRVLDDIDVYFWPGYHELRPSQRSHRTFYRVSEDDRRGCGIGFRGGGQAYYQCAASYWFHAALGPGLPKGFSSGGTHDWISGMPYPHISRIGKRMLWLAVQLGQVAKTPERRSGLFLITLTAEETRWGDQVSKLLNDTSKVTYGVPFDEKPKKKRWPYVVSEESVRPNVQSLRNRLYSIWLIAVFRPDLLCAEVICDAIMPKMHRLGGDTLKKEVCDALLTTWTLYRSELSDLDGKLHFYRRWYTLACAAAVSRETPDAPPAPLGSGMFLSTESIKMRVLQELKWWLDTVYADLRLIDMSNLHAKSLSSAVRNRFQEDLAHAMAGSLSPLDALVREAGDEHQLPAEVTVRSAERSLRKLKWLTAVFGPRNFERKTTGPELLDWNSCLQCVVEQTKQSFIRRAPLAFADKRADSSINDEAFDRSIKDELYRLGSPSRNLDDVLAQLAPDGCLSGVVISTQWQTGIVEGLVIEMLSQAVFHGTVTWLLSENRPGRYLRFGYDPASSILQVSNRSKSRPKEGGFTDSLDHQLFERIRSKLEKSDPNKTKRYLYTAEDQWDEESWWLRVRITI